MMEQLKKLWAGALEVFKEWTEDDAQTWAASVTFYTIISLAPLLVLAVAIAGFVFGEDAAQGELVRQLNGIMGSAGAEVLQDTIASASPEGSKKGVVATVVSLALLFLGASKVFDELRSALNRMWGVKIDPEAGWKLAVQKKIAGFGMVLATGFLLLIAIIFSTFLEKFLELMGGVAQTHWFLSALNFVSSLAVTTLLFGALFKYVPDVKIQWREVAFGAVCTAGLFAIGKFALGLYIAHGDLGSAYGAASSLFVLLAWFYYSVQIFFVGAEITQVHARHMGHHIQPDKDAIELVADCKQPGAAQ